MVPLSTGRKYPMTTLKLLKRDIKLGIIERLLPYLIVLFTFFMVKDCSRAIADIQIRYAMQSPGTIMDYYVYCMSGMGFYQFDPTEGFLIPYLWFISQLGISYIIAYYAEKDFTENGVNVMVAGRNRSAWWFSKVIWCVMSVLIYFVATFTACSVFAMFYGAKPSLGVTDEFLKIVYGYNINYLPYKDLMLIVFVVPITVTTGICLVQMLMSFIISPVTSFAITCAVYILSAYYTVWFLPGSYTMWVRSSYFDVRGLNPLSGLLIAAFMVVAVVVLGKSYFERKDVI